MGVLSGGNAWVLVSNIFFLLPLAVAIARKRVVLSWWLANTTVASFVYHWFFLWADYCVEQPDERISSICVSLINIDFFFSFGAAWLITCHIALTKVPQSPKAGERKKTSGGDALTTHAEHIASIIGLSVLFPLVAFDMVRPSIYLIVAFVVVAVSLVALAACLRPRKKIFQIGAWNFVLGGVAAAIGAALQIVTMFQEDQYPVLHGTWHILLALAAVFMIQAPYSDNFAAWFCFPACRNYYQRFYQSL